MNIFQYSYVYILCFVQIFLESIRNSLRFTPFGPKRYKGIERLDGKVVIITGSNTGIGKETAKQLAKRGAKVIIACRNVMKGFKAVEDIKKTVPDANLEVHELDLSSLASVRKFAKDVYYQEPVIDILINNAGIMFCPQAKTEDGFEVQMGTNYLGHFLLTLLLLDQLKKSTQGRIINVSSVAHIRGEINFDDFFSEKTFDNRIDAYTNSKLAIILITRELAKRLTGTNVRCYSLHPGLINTPLWKYATGYIAYYHRLFGRLFQMDVELGSQTILYCALNEKLKYESGHYYSNCGRVENMMKSAVDDITASKLWKFSCQLVKYQDNSFQDYINNNEYNYHTFSKVL